MNRQKLPSEFIAACMDLAERHNKADQEVLDHFLKLGYNVDEELVKSVVARYYDPSDPCPETLRAVSPYNLFSQRLKANQEYTSNPQRLTPEVIAALYKEQTQEEIEELVQAAKRKTTELQNSIWSDSSKHRSIVAAKSLRKFYALIDFIKNRFGYFFAGIFW